MDKDISKMSLEELIALNQELMAQRAAIKETKRLVDGRINVLMAEVEAKKKLAAMSDEEKAALVQMVQAEGIASEEAVKGLA